MLLELIDEARGTFSHCVPTILHMLLTAPARRKDLSRLEGGHRRLGPAPRARQAALARGIDVFTGYGMSETCPILTVSHLNRRDAGLAARPADRRHGADGPALPLVELGIVDLDGAELPPGKKSAARSWCAPPGSPGGT